MKSNWISCFCHPETVVEFFDLSSFSFIYRYVVRCLDLSLDSQTVYQQYDLGSYSRPFLFLLFYYNIFLLQMLVLMMFCAS